MSFVINTNLAATTASLHTNRADKAFGKSLETLSTGKRLQGPADDAGGLSVALKLNSRNIRTEVLARNAQNALSYLQAQDGFLKNVGAIFDRFGELRTMAQDVTKNSADLENYSQEFIELQRQLDSMSDETFNGINLFAETDDPDSTVDVEEDALIDNHSQYGGTPQYFAKHSKVLSLDPSGNASGVSVSMVNLDYVYEINWGAIDPKYLTRAGGGGAPGGGGGGAAQGGIFINSILAISMGQITNAIEKVAETRAENGAEQNAVREAHEKLRSSLPNLEDAHGRIMDADIAAETTELAKHKIMREAGVSMHAQANRLTYLGLTLMGLN